MIAETFGSLIAAAPNAIFRARVVRVNDDSTVLVSSFQETRSTCLCDRLVTGADVTLAPGDTVLCHLSASGNERGIVLGRVGPSLAPVVAPAQAEDVADETPAAAVPDTLLIEAKQEITLRVGKGSITIRADGKVLIKGKDLVTHATRLNRIKGGSVAIN